MAHCNWTRTMIVALALGAVTASPALAADDGDDWRPGRGYMMHGQGYGPMHGGWGPGRMRGPMMGLDEDAMLDRIDGRLAFMKAELKIEDAQEDAWKEFAEAVRSTAETRNEMMRSMRESLGNGDFLDKSMPDRLTLRETHLEARLEEVRTVRAAAETLYGVLSDDQKLVADEIVLPAMGMGMGRMHGRRWRR